MLDAKFKITTRLIFNIYGLLTDVGKRVKSIIQKMFHNLMILKVCTELFCLICLRGKIAFYTYR